MNLEATQTITPSESTELSPKMKKIAFIICGIALAIALTITLFFVFRHKHSWTDWETTKEKTCTENGIKERICSCGAKETETIYCTGHNFATWGICLDCNYGWVTINLPETPITVKDSYSSFEISDIKYELGRYDSGYLVRVFYSGIQTYSKFGNSDNTSFSYKLVDSDGYIVFSGYALTPVISVGDKIKNESFEENYVYLDPYETYTLIISNR